MVQRATKKTEKFNNIYDPEEFSRFYDEMFPRLFAYIAYRVGRRQDAEDLVSQTFLKVVEKIETFEYHHPGSLEAWIFTIAQNLIKNHYRKNGRSQSVVSLDEIPDL